MGPPIVIRNFDLKAWAHDPCQLPFIVVALHKGTGHTVPADRSLAFSAELLNDLGNWGRQRPRLAGDPLSRATRPRSSAAREQDQQDQSSERHAQTHDGRDSRLLAAEKCHRLVLTHAPTARCRRACSATLLTPSAWRPTCPLPTRSARSRRASPVILGTLGLSGFVMIAVCADTTTWRTRRCPERALRDLPRRRPCGRMRRIYAYL